MSFNFPELFKNKEEKLDPEWFTMFSKLTDDFSDITDILNIEAKKCRIVPNQVDLFHAYELCQLRETKVVIFGQDPYFNLAENGEPQATGLSFSVREGIKIPPSLQNIFKEIQAEYPDWKHPGHGSLESWAKQGVLLLNASLTTRLGTAGAHDGLWNFLLVSTIAEITRVNRNCIFVLWGRHAQTLKKYLKGQILESAHPSSFSAYGRNGKDGFFGNGHFKKVNDLLKKDGKKEILW